MNSAYPLAFLIGVFSAMHCAGMCGGIVGALSYSFPAEIRRAPLRLLLFLLALNLGRIASYAAAGALFGWAGGAVAGEGPAGIERGLRVLAALIVIGIGLHLGGWFPRLSAIEHLGQPVWNRIAPLTRRLIPVRSLGLAVLYGSLWGWLPCGLVYTLLISSPAQTGALSGAVYMALFGVGTLLVTMGGGLLAGRLYEFAQQRPYQIASGLIVIALGLSTLFA